MSRFLLLLIVLCTHTILYGQEQRPWLYGENDAKVFLQTEPGVILVKFKKRYPDIPFVQKVTADGIVKTEATSWPGVQKVYTNKPVNEVLAAIRRDTSIAFSWQALYFNDAPYLPTGEIVVIPKAGTDLLSDLNMLQLTNKVAVVTNSEKRYGEQEVLRVKSDGDLFNIANALQETGHYVCATPDCWAHVKFGTTNDPLYSAQT